MDIEQLQFIIIPIIGIIATFIVGIIPYIIYKKERSIKSLSFEVVLKAPLFRFPVWEDRRLQIYLDGELIEHAFFISFKFINTGNIPINASDYERPISIIFYDKMRVLTADIEESNPENLQLSPIIDVNKVLLSKALLNSGDSFALKLIVSGEGSYKLDYRITGIKTIEKVQIPKIKLERAMTIFYTAIIVYTISIIFYLIKIQYDIIILLNYLGFIFMAIAFITYVIEMFKGIAMIVKFM